MCSRFPTPIHCALHVSAVFSTTLAAAVHLEGFSDGVCHGMKVTVAVSIPHMGLLAQQTFCCFVPVGHLPHRVYGVRGSGRLVLYRHANYRHHILLLPMLRQVWGAPQTSRPQTCGV